MMPRDDCPLIMTVPQTAAYLGISAKRLRRLMEKVPEFPRVQIAPGEICVPRPWLNEWLRGHGLALPGPGTVIPFPIKEDNH